MRANREGREDVVMALSRNNTVLPRHGNYSGAQSRAYSSSSCFCVFSVSGLWPKIFPIDLRGSHCRALFPSVSNQSFYRKPTPKANAEKHEGRQQSQQEEEYQVLTQIRSNYNDIFILDTAKSRILLLDSSCNCRFCSFLFLFY